jgi:hypothetical protein
MYRVDYLVRESGGTWRPEIATFDFITPQTAPTMLARRHAVAEADIRLRSVDEYNSMSELNDLLRG